MIKSFTIFVFITATLTCARVYEWHNIHKLSRSGIMLTLEQKIELIKQFKTDGDWENTTPLKFFNPFMNQWEVEEFRAIKEIEGYEVSNLGRVKSLPKESLPTWHRSGQYINRTLTERILKFGKDQRGYLIGTVGNKNSQKTRRLHVLVWDAFGDTPRDGRKINVDHIWDENKTLNWIGNLQTLTNRENLSKGKAAKRDLPTGVYYHKNRYVARIGYDNKYELLGRFQTPKEASVAYQKRLKEIKELDYA